MKILVTGSSGFIGTHLMRSLRLFSAHSIVGIDKVPGSQTDIVEDLATSTYIEKTSPPCDFVIHLAGLSGVRESDDHPEDYIQTNIQITTRILEQIRQRKTGRFIYASSSSVYGDSELPFTEDKPLPTPKSIYSLSKQTLEKLAEYYWSRFRVPSVGLRFFTVYGSGSRKNMALHLFTEAVLNDHALTVYHDGSQLRDFTHVSDVVNGIRCALLCRKDDAIVVNIGSGNPISIQRVLEILESTVGKPLTIDYKKSHPADGKGTFASLEKAKQLLNYTPSKMFEPEFQSYIQEMKFFNTPFVSTLKKVFITSLFCEDGQSEPIDTPKTFKKLDGWDYLLFTNCTIAQESTSWSIQKINIQDYTEAKKSITRSRLPKFNPWALPELQSYDVIVYMDGYLAPEPKSEMWDSICEELVKGTDFIGFPHPKRTNLFDELSAIVQAKKDKLYRMELTYKYFKSIGCTPTNPSKLYENKSFAYSPHNLLIKEMFLQIWKWLEKDQLTHRDQPIHSYLCSIYRPTFKPYSDFGKAVYISGTSKPHHYAIQSKHA